VPTIATWGGSVWGGAIWGPGPVVRVPVVGPSPYQSSVARIGPDPWEGATTAPRVVPDRGTLVLRAGPGPWDGSVTAPGVVADKGTVDTTVLANYSSVARMR
jgi:hypothetical protein